VFVVLEISPVLWNDEHNHFLPIGVDGFGPPVRMGKRVRITRTAHTYEQKAHPTMCPALIGQNSRGTR
ncbi:hypothetical protein, partial [Streptococcus pseudopneumoniae]|uniref:hypothetical protein n=1 Tax=Streptococcus pseudopneumoniae TaxID=257758 RepID=UPI0019D65632